MAEQAKAPQRNNAPTPHARSADTNLREGSLPRGEDLRDAGQNAARRELATYDIKKGDTFASIAKAFEMSIQDVQRLNPDASPRKLEIGQRIFVTKAAPPEHSQDQVASYYIKRGDTLGEIARDLKIPLAQIVALNPSIDPRKLEIGQRVVLPRLQQPPAPAAAPDAVPTARAASPDPAADLSSAFAVLDQYRARVEGEGRTFVMSTRSRPNPEAALALHRLLNAAGALPPLSGDLFNDRTFEALRNFQTAHGLVPDGKFGTETLQSFKNALNRVETSAEFVERSASFEKDRLSAVRAGTVVLRWNGAAGAAADQQDPLKVAMVRDLQNLLNEAGSWPILAVNGIFDETTKKAVMNFQASQKLKPEGAVGVETMKALDTSREKFLTALRRVLGEEGGYSNHKHDRGGVTFKGVTQGTYDEWRDKHRLAARPVTEMDPLEARVLYRELFWQRAYCDRYSEKIATVVFDTAVNCGPGTARTHVKQTVGDLEITESDLKEPERSLERSAGNKLVDLRNAHHQNLMDADPSQESFRRGWERRIGRLRQYVMAH